MNELGICEQDMYEQGMNEQEVNGQGISELGRMSGWYRDLFGESPSATRANRPGREPEQP